MIFKAVHQGTGSAAPRVIRLAMVQSKTCIERAFELANSGACGSVYRIERQLLREGYYIEQIAGPTIRRQLRELLTKAPQHAPDG